MKKFTLVFVTAALMLSCSAGDKSPVMGIEGNLDGTGDNAADGMPEDVTIDNVSADLVEDGFQEVTELDDASTAEVDLAVDVPVDLGPVDLGPPGGCPAADDGYVDALCDTFCDAIDKFNLELSFATPDKCPALCRETLADHPDWLSNFMCVSVMEEHYYFGNCWWPKPLPDIPGCVQWCEAAIPCGANWILQVPADQCLCESACNGLFALTGEAAGPLVECATEKLEESCDVEEMFNCFGMPLNCDQVCNDLEDKCDPGHDLAPLYDDSEECIDQCQGYSQPQLLAQSLCFDIDKCKDPLLCAQVPEEPVDGCLEYCQGYLDLCPFVSMDEFYCQWICTGATMAIPLADPEGGLECLAGYDECPDNADGVLFSCLLGKCSMMCHVAPSQCEDDSAYYDYFETVEQCQGVCNSYNQFQADTAAMCLFVGGCDQPEVCHVPPEEPSAACIDYCDAILDLCPGMPNLNADSCPDFCEAVQMLLPILEPESAGECLAQFDGCPEDVEEALFGCLTGKCGLMCGLSDLCEPGTAYFDVFESDNACKEYCDALTWNQAVAVNQCLSFVYCDGAASCIDPPEETPMGCDTYCQTLFDICPDNNLVGKTNCLDSCTGLTMAIPGAQPWDADECYDEFETCPAEPSAVVYGCMVDEGEECDDACNALADCGWSEAWLCDIYCTILETTDAYFHEVFTECVANADSCAAMAPCVGE